MSNSPLFDPQQTFLRLEQCLRDDKLFEVLPYLRQNDVTDGLYKGLRTTSST